MPPLICAYCGGRGKGVTLIKDDPWYVCNDGEACAKRASDLTPDQADFLARERYRRIGETDDESVQHRPKR